MDNETFFFLCYPRGDKGTINVVDLAHVVDYERDEWSCVTPHNYDNRDDAIREARRLASQYGKTYDMFESRYDESTNEYLGEFE